MFTCQNWHILETNYGTHLHVKIGRNYGLTDVPFQTKMEQQTITGRNSTPGERQIPAQYCISRPRMHSEASKDSLALFATCTLLLH